MAMRYVVLGDVVGSRMVENRETFGERLTDACEELNREHAGDIRAPFTALKGVDEIGGVLASVGSVYDVVEMLFARLRPHEIRLVVVYGAVDVGADAAAVSEMDGPAFHRADELLVELERDDLLFGMEVGDRALDTALSGEVNLLLFDRRRLTDRQREVVARYRERGNQYAVAESLDISQPAVSKALERAGWPAVRTIEDRLRETLRTYEP